MEGLTDYTVHTFLINIRLNDFICTGFCQTNTTFFSTYGIIYSIIDPLLFLSLWRIDSPERDLRDGNRDLANPRARHWRGTF